MGGDKALATAKSMLLLLRDIGDHLGSVAVNGGDSGIGTHLGTMEHGDSRSVVAANHWDAMSDKDSVSLQVTAQSNFCSHCNCYSGSLSRRKSGGEDPLRGGEQPLRWASEARSTRLCLRADQVTIKRSKRSI